MALALSVALASAVLALTLMIQSQILLGTPEKLISLSKRLKQLSFFIAIPIGVILIIVGSIWFPNIGSFIIVGLTYIILTINLLVRSRIIDSPGKESLQKFGRFIKICSLVLFGAVCIGTVVTVTGLIISIV